MEGFGAVFLQFNVPSWWNVRSYYLTLCLYFVEEIRVNVCCRSVCKQKHIVDDFPLCIACKKEVQTWKWLVEYFVYIPSPLPLVDNAPLVLMCACDCMKLMTAFCCPPSPPPSFQTQVILELVHLQQKSLYLILLSCASIMVLNILCYNRICSC